MVARGHLSRDLDSENRRSGEINNEGPGSAGIHSTTFRRYRSAMPPGSTPPNVARSARSRLISILLRLRRLRSASPLERELASTPGLVAVVAAALVVLVVLVLKVRHHQSQPEPPIETQQAAPATVAPASQTEFRNSISKGTSVKGAVVERVQPEVSRNASRTIQGRVKVTIRLTVGPNGNVSNAAFDSSGPSKYFANLALQAARQWKFKPPDVEGQAVPSVWILQFQFGRDGDRDHPCGSIPLGLISCRSEHCIDRVSRLVSGYGLRPLLAAYRARCGRPQLVIHGRPSRTLLFQGDLHALRDRKWEPCYLVHREQRGTPSLKASCPRAKRLCRF